MPMGLLCTTFIRLRFLEALLVRLHERVFLRMVAAEPVAAELQQWFSQQILTPVFCTRQCPHDLSTDFVRWKAAKVSDSGCKPDSVCCKHVFKSNNCRSEQWKQTLNQWLYTCCDVPWHPKSNCKLIRLTLHDWNKLSLINESEAQLAPYCTGALQSSHNHQMVRKWWTWWLVSTEQLFF